MEYSIKNNLIEGFEGKTLLKEFMDENLIEEIVRYGFFSEDPELSCDFENETSRAFSAAVSGGNSANLDEAKKFETYSKLEQPKNSF